LCRRRVDLDYRRVDLDLDLDLVLDRLLALPPFAASEGDFSLSSSPMSGVMSAAAALRFFIPLDILAASVRASASRLSLTLS